MSDHKSSFAIKYGTSPKTFQSCVVGFALSLVFTLVAFFLVWMQPVSVSTIFVLLAILALVQLVTQVYFFLRLNATAEGRYNLLPFIFSVVIISVILGGSLWIMYNLNYNMMH